MTVCGRTDVLRVIRKGLYDAVGGWRIRQCVDVQISLGGELEPSLLLFRWLAWRSFDFEITNTAGVERTIGTRELPHAIGAAIRDPHVLTRFVGYAVHQNNAMRR
jgi:hypothetical protein